MGFTFDDQNLARGSSPIAEMYRLIEQDPRNAERILPYIGGEEVNSSPTHDHRRFVINFEDFPLRREDVGARWAEANVQQRRDWLRRGIVPLDYLDPVAADWPDLLAIVEARVKPVRVTDNRAAYRNYWWRYAERRGQLYAAITGLERVLVAGSQASAHYALAFLPTGVVYSSNLSVIAVDAYAGFAAVQSRLHEVWARFFMSTMEDRLAYTPTSCFEPFPFPSEFESDPILEATGEAYYRFRAELMVARDRGQTKTYNDFHDRRLRNDPEIQRLRELHHAMDQAVLRAYGWHDLAEVAAPVFLDEENEDEFAYQGRLFWPSDFRDEVLARLLALNAERHADEVRRGVAPRQGGRAQATGRAAGLTADEEGYEGTDDEGEAA